MWRTDALVPYYEDVDGEIGRWTWQCPGCHTEGHVLLKQQLSELTCKVCGRVWVREWGKNHYRTEGCVMEPKLRLLMDD